MLSWATKTLLSLPSRLSLPLEAFVWGNGYTLNVCIRRSLGKDYKAYSPKFKRRAPSLKLFLNISLQRRFFSFSFLFNILFIMYFGNLFVWLCLAFSSHALSYWIDSSCTGKLDNAVLDEVKLMGSEGSTRLGNSGDSVMADAFLQIFKVDKTNVNAVGKATSKTSLHSPKYL